MRERNLFTPSEIRKNEKISNALKQDAIMRLKKIKKNSKKNR